MAKPCNFIQQNSDYELLLGDDGALVQSRTEAGFEFLFKTAKTNFGVKQGRLMYEVKIDEILKPQEYYGPGHRAKNELSKQTLEEFNQQYALRIGWSQVNNQKPLGQDNGTIAIDNYGSKWNNGLKQNYCDQLNVGDVIRCCIELNHPDNVVYYFKNGKYLGVCEQIPSQKGQNKPWFPAISLRNVKCIFNFGQFKQDLFPIERTIHEIQEENKDIIDKSNKQNGQENLAENGIETEKENVQKIQNLEETKEQEKTQMQTESEKTNDQPNDNENNNTTNQENKEQPENKENQEKTQEKTQEEMEIEKQNQEKQKQEEEERKKQEEIKQKQLEQQKEEEKIIREAQIQRENQLIEFANSFKFINDADEDQREYFSGYKNEGRPKLIVMVGLPGSGKTTFAEQYIQKFPQTQVLSTQQIYDHITKNIRITNIQNKIILLMELCDEIFCNQMRLCSQLKRDVLIDQTNVLIRSRLEKLKYFQHHQTEAVVIVCTETDLLKRQLKKQNKSDRFIPRCGIQTLANLKENFVIPTEYEGFERVHFVELEEDQCRKIVVISKEISQLQTHPLLRPKHFKEIDEFKKEHNLPENINYFDHKAYKLKLKQQQLEKERQERLKKEQEEQKKREEEEELRRKQQEEENEKLRLQQEEQKKQQQLELNTIQSQQDNQINQNNQENQKNQQTHSVSQSQERQQTPNSQQQQQQSKPEAQQQPRAPDLQPINVINMPPQPPQPPQFVPNVGASNLPSPFPVQNASPYPTNPSREGSQHPTNKGAQKRDKQFQKQNQKNNANFNRLSEKRQEQFPYSSKPTTLPQQPQLQPQHQPQYPPQQPPSYPPQPQQNYQQYPSQQIPHQQQYQKQQQSYPQQQYHQQPHNYNYQYQQQQQQQPQPVQQHYYPQKQNYQPQQTQQQYYPHNQQPQQQQGYLQPQQQGYPQQQQQGGYPYHNQQQSYQYDYRR
ncbi:P-loop containing nucleoside triphosphate hydrolase [Pseudocohnilembus persalinus]|uniref:p-loop containing nucleoside triphosphate hydrolase n=1 Tax=Pseudocohnilembus persalinus TaxID=266149 RepID=A0A0V0QAZ9_PSEPJ|nr:P-loop containing nucleoside triphosphate hydrolase [Pseudocohnilembus persalinus]|eukprot:KRW99345.1 P-loop containing nucleoside triphosphate hydrolase [Pseudocohnilembus persalinus]